MTKDKAAEVASEAQSAEEEVQPTEAPKEAPIVNTVFDGMPEAGGIAFCKLFGVKSGHDVEINITSRGPTPIHALDELLKAIAHGEKAYNLRPYMVGSEAPKAAAPAVAPTAAAPAPAGTIEPTYVPVSTPSTPVGQPAGSIPQDQGGIVNVVRLVVTPQATGKSKIEFWGAGRQYADLTAYWTPEQASAMMAGIGAWTPAHFQTAKNYSPVNFKVNWVFGNMNPKTQKPYKNIVSITL